MHGLVAGPPFVHLTRGCADALDITQPFTLAFSGDSIPLTASSQRPLSIPFGPESPHPGSNPLPSYAIDRLSNPLRSEAIRCAFDPVCWGCGHATGSLATTVAWALGASSAAELTHAPEPRTRPF